MLQQEPDLFFCKLHDYVLLQVISNDCRCWYVVFQAKGGRTTRNVPAIIVSFETVRMVGGESKQAVNFFTVVEGDGLLQLHLQQTLVDECVGLLLSKCVRHPVRKVRQVTAE